MRKHTYKKLYKQIWDERKTEDETGTYAICAQTGKRIYESQLTTWSFRHIKSKGSHPELKYDPDNIEIVTADWHGQEHCSGKFNNHLGL
jgi:hypothetical protein